jgi:rSAM/selenodomain-associated transferase 1
MTRIVVFAKAPRAGFVKTRLIPALGAEGAATLARALLNHTLDQALASGATVELCMSPAPSDPAWQGVALPQAVARSNQGDGDLGTRMNSAVERALALQQGPVLVIGTDCPALTADHLREASRQLAQHDAVLLPASDGGYVLIGLQAPCASLFTDMAWSTPAVAFETLRRMERLGLSVWQGPVMHDIDEPGDLVHLPEALKSRPF